MRSCETMARLRSDAAFVSGNTLGVTRSRVSIAWSSPTLTIMIIHYLGLFMEKIDIIQKLKIEKDNFLDEKHLDWYVLTFIRNYPEFLENDYNNAMTLAKQHIDDYEQLTQYIVDLNNAYLSAKSYLGIDWKLLL